MSVKIHDLNANEPIEVTKFPAGESYVKVPGTDKFWFDGCTIELKYESDADLISMLMAVDAIRRVEPRAEINLHMPYLPHARQDRVCREGESFSLQVVANLINSCGFDSVSFMDVHSSVALDLIWRSRNVIFTEMYGFDDRMFDDVNCIVAPDKGAVERAQVFAESILIPADEVVYATKGRTPEGKPYFVGIEGNIPKDANILIVDDICDAGGSFIGLAQHLRPLTTGTIELFVTHAILSKGAQVFDGIIDTVYTPNLMGQPHKLVKEL